MLQDPAALVERLRAGDIEARERAEAELVRIGAPAEAALDEASRDADPEVAARARGLLLRAVAAHRGEVLRELRHIGRHLSDAARFEHADQILALTGALRRMDPEHPLAKEFTIRGLWSMERDFRHPARDVWTQIRGKVAEDVENASYCRSCEACVTRRLMTAKVGFAFENAKVEDILAHLREVADLNLILDAGMIPKAVQARSRFGDATPRPLMACTKGIDYRCCLPALAGFVALKSHRTPGLTPRPAR